MKEKVSAENRVREIRRKTRKKYSSEEKVRIVLGGLRGEESIAALYRREGFQVNRRIFPEEREQISDHTVDCFCSSDRRRKNREP